MAAMYGNALESAPPLMGPVPGDIMEETLDGHLQASLSMLGRDGLLTPDEMRSVGAFLKGLQMIATGRAGRGEPGAMGMEMQGAMNPAGPPAPNPVDYGSLGGVNKHPDGMWSR